VPQKAIGEALKKGEEIFQNVSVKLLEQPAVAKAFEAAMAGRSRVDEGVTRALKKLNVQTRSEFRALKARVDALEVQLAELREALESLKTSSGGTSSGRAARARPAPAKSSGKARSKKASGKA
jgi:polyhydroxyalkanoate synthesis regulator phasin